MRIIANEIDYYDCVQASGQDQSLLYIRKPEEVFLEWRDWPFPKFHGQMPRGIGSWLHMIGFCGKIYPAIELQHMVGVRTVKAFCYSVPDIDKFFEAYARKPDLKVYHGEKANRSIRSPFGWFWISPRQDYVKFFEECKQHHEKHEEMFEEHRCPVFVASIVGRRSNTRIEWNATLRHYDFMRIFDPYGAYQEIAMYLGNMAMPEKEMPVIPDEVKAESKGFNKWSFRRPPGGK
jgi:hypothetical protein